MRVIAGKAKGRVLFSPKGKLIRPTSDRTKEFIFNYISQYVPNAVVLDLFAGTGNLSIEALSRGAQHATLIDNSKEAIKLIYRNLELTNFLTQATVVRKDVLRYLKFIHNNNFGLIFADPPYLDRVCHQVIEHVDKYNVLTEGGLFVIEHSSRLKCQSELQTLIIKNVRILGDTAVTIYQKKGENFENRNLSGDF